MYANYYHMYFIFASSAAFEEKEKINQLTWIEVLISEEK